MADITLSLALIWIIVCVVMFCAAVCYRSGRLDKLPIGWVLGVALVLRLVPAVFLRQGANYEMALFQDTASKLLAGGDVTLALPYLPCFVYWMALSDYLSRDVGLHFTTWLKLPSILADVSFVWILNLYLTSAGWPRRKVRRAVVLYALNPVSILVSAYHGQFDVLPTMCLILSLMILEADDYSMRRVILASLSVGLGIFLKTWPGLLCLCILVRPRFRHKSVFLLGSAIVPFLGTLGTVLVSDKGGAGLFSVARRALQAGAVPGWWGYTGLINGVEWLLGKGPTSFAGLALYKLPIVLVPVIMMVWESRRLDLHDSFFWPLVTLFVFAPGLGLQSLCWLVPLFVVRGHWRDLVWYVCLSTLHMLISYWGIHFSPNLYRLLPSDIVNGVVQISAVPVWLLLLYLLGSHLVTVTKVYLQRDLLKPDLAPEKWTPR